MRKEGSARCEPPVPVPIHLLTGFLGSGKTTLLNALLGHADLSATAVVVNEFGETGIDHLLVERVEGDILLLATGCICCAARGEVTEALQRLLEGRAAGRYAFDRIVIETTGLADPGPVMNAILLAPSVAAWSRVGTVIAVVDAVLGAQTLADTEEARLQVALADRIVLTKTDLLGEHGQVEGDLASRIRELNREAPIDFSADAIRSGPALFSAIAPRADAPFRTTDTLPSQGHEATTGPRHHGHGRPFGACTLRSEGVDLATLQAFFEVLLRRVGSRLLRVKGLVRFLDDPTRPAVVHVVRQLLHPVRRLPAWPDDDHSTRLVVITLGSPPAELSELWESFFGPPGLDRPDGAALSRSLEAGGGLFG